jgi:hypothetical protein
MLRTCDFMMLAIDMSSPFLSFHSRLSPVKSSSYAMSLPSAGTVQQDGISVSRMISLTRSCRVILIDGTALTFFGHVESSSVISITSSEAGSSIFTMDSRFRFGNVFDTINGYIGEVSSLPSEIGDDDLCSMHLAVECRAGEDP